MGALIDAITSGDEAEALRLVSADPAAARERDGNGVSAPLLALYHGRAELAATLLAAVPEPDVFEAAGFGLTDRLASLLDSDATLANAYGGDGFTPLHLAAFFGRTEAAALLVERNADVSLVARNPMRLEAIHSAAAARQLEIARLLLDRGSDPNARQEGGFTPLHAAAQNGDDGLAALLLERGAAAAAETPDGRTAASIARVAGHAELAARLEAQD